MTLLVHRLSAVVIDEAGRRWAASLRGDDRQDGTLEGFLDFDDPDGDRVSISTVQGTRDDLIYWADNLSPSDLDGWLAKARGFGEDVLPLKPPASGGARL